MINLQTLKDLTVIRVIFANLSKKAIFRRLIVNKILKIKPLGTTTQSLIKFLVNNQLLTNLLSDSRKN